MDEQPESVKQQLRVIYRTRGVSPHPIVAHPRVPADHRARILAAFLAISEDAQGRAFLSHLPIVQLVPADKNDCRAIREWGLSDYYVAPRQ
jgi:phosphonate transport system substrate-binding protein